jgi:hypothetical protein
MFLFLFVYLIPSVSPLISSSSHFTISSFPCLSIHCFLLLYPISFVLFLNFFVFALYFCSLFSFYLISYFCSSISMSTHFTMSSLFCYPKHFSFFFLSHSFCQFLNFQFSSFYNIVFAMTFYSLLSHLLSPIPAFCSAISSFPHFTKLPLKCPIHFFLLLYPVPSFCFVISNSNHVQCRLYSVFLNLPVLVSLIFLILLHLPLPSISSPYIHSMHYPFFHYPWHFATVPPHEIPLVRSIALSTIFLPSESQKTPSNS